MKKRFEFMNCIVFLGTLFFHIHASSIEVSPAAPYRIFILHSYEADHVCGQPQHDGVIAALYKAGFKEKDMVIDTYFMDTKRSNNTVDLILEQARLALDKIQAFQPDVLITLDDNAFRTVALRLVDSNISIVFSGMNGQPEDYNKAQLFMLSRSHPGHNITGVYEKLHIADAFRVHANLFPGLKKIKIYTDTSPTGKAISKQISIELQQESALCFWEMKIVESWEDYQKEIYSISEDPSVDAIYPAVLMVKDKNGKTYTAPDIFAWTVQNSKKPEIALNYEFTRMGLFGGAAVDFYSMGSQAGQMVIRILKGEKTGDISIEEAHRYALVFNLKRSYDLGIEIPSDILLAADEVVLGKK